MARAAGKPGTRGSPGGSCAFPPAPGRLANAVPPVKVFFAPADLETAEVSASSVRSAPRILLRIKSLCREKS